MPAAARSRMRSAARGSISRVVQRRGASSPPRRGSFKSAAELKERIEGFIAYFNETMAKPFRWTFTGKPLAT